MSIVNKKVNLNLVGIDGNAFAIMGAFAGQAKKEKWTKTEIDSVLNAAMASGDYVNLLGIIMEHCESPLSENEPDEEYDDPENEFEWDEYDDEESEKNHDLWRGENKE